MRFLRFEPLEERIVLDGALAQAVTEIPHATPTAPHGVDTHLVVISESIAHPEIIQRAAAQDTIIVTYDPTKETLNSLSQKINNALQGTKVKDVTFVTEGSTALFDLVASEKVSHDALQDIGMINFWKDLASNILPEGSVNIAGCSVASDISGQTLINDLDSILNSVGHNIDVNASIDLTGSSILGGDWILEYSTNPHQSSLDLSRSLFDSNILNTWNSTLVNDVSGVLWRDLNGNGVKDAGEPGISGLTVVLTRTTSLTTPVATTTDANGNYSFTGVVNGTYFLRWQTPYGHSITTAGIDSSATTTDGNFGKSANFTMSGPTITRNAGMYFRDTTNGLLTIGDNVWNDQNANGLHEGGETQISGVTVSLLGLNGATVTTLRTTVTALFAGNSGHFSFDSIVPTSGTSGFGYDSYELQFAAVAGFNYTTQRVGADNTINSAPNASTGITAPITGVITPVGVASTWNESGNAQDGTGGSFQTVTGTNSINAITGSLNGNQDVDAYKVYIKSPGAFTAIQSGAGDGKISIFRLNGGPVVFDDDISGANTHAQIIGSSLTNFAPGFYLIAYSSTIRSATDANGQKIWQDTPLFPQRTPDGTSGGQYGTLTGWTGAGTNNSSYTITFAAGTVLGSSVVAITDNNQDAGYAIANLPPVNSVPATQTMNEDATLVFSSGNSNLISISDPDAGANSVRVTLTATNGVMSLSGIAGLTFTVGDGTTDSTMTFSGTITNLNAALSGMSFLPTLNVNGTGAGSIQIITNDLGNTGSGGAQSDTDTVSINITAVNDAPVNSVPGTQSISEDTSRVFSSGNSNLISISDVDAGGSSVQVALTGTNGVMSLSGTTGLTFSVGDEYLRHEAQ